MLVAALAVAISINWELAVVMLVTIPLLVIAIGVLMGVCNRLFQASKSASTPQRHRAGKPGGHPGGEGLRPGGL